MKTDTFAKMLVFLHPTRPTTAKQIADHLEVSRVMVHRYLLRATQEWQIYKRWVPPRVVYFRKEEISDSPYCRTMPGVTGDAMTIECDSFFEKHFSYVSPDGYIGLGYDAFSAWCVARNLDVRKEAEIYHQTWLKYNTHRSENGIIDGMKKMTSTFSPVHLDAIFYADFYAIEKYGKTVLWNLVFIAKQNGDKKMTKEISEKIKPLIDSMIRDEKIDSFAFIPPSIDRKVQFLHELKRYLQIQLPEIKIEKYYNNGIRIAQKSLSKITERRQNARDTIFPTGNTKNFWKTILIDDAVGSWATLNETAKKLKEWGFSSSIIGLAIVGSAKGFEVIKEV